MKTSLYTDPDVSAQVAWDAFLTDMQRAAKHARIRINVIGDCASGSFRLYRFGAYGWTVVAVGSDGDRPRSIEAGLELAAEWLAENAPGIFAELDFTSAREGLEADGRIAPEATDEDSLQLIYDYATADLTYTESGYLCAWEWTVDDVDSRADLLTIQLGM